MSADPLDKQLVEAVLSRPRRAKADLEEAKLAGLRPSRPKAGVAIAGDDDDEDDDEDLDLGVEAAEDGADVGIVVVADDGVVDPGGQAAGRRAGQARPEGGRGAHRRGARRDLGRHDRHRRPGPDVPQGDRQGRPPDRRGRGRPGQGHRARRADGRGAVEGDRLALGVDPQRHRAQDPTAKPQHRLPFGEEAHDLVRRAISDETTADLLVADARLPPHQGRPRRAVGGDQGAPQGGQEARPRLQRGTDGRDLPAVRRLRVPGRPQRRPRLARQRGSAGDLRLDPRGRRLPGARALDPGRQRRRSAQAMGYDPEVPLNTKPRDRQGHDRGHRPRRARAADLGQPPAGRLDRQEVHRPRHVVPGPDPGGQHRADPGGREVRLREGLQVLDLRHVVDPAGHHPGHRRPGADDPHPGPHGRDDQPAHPRVARPAPGARPRADGRGDRRGDVQGPGGPGHAGEGPRDHQGLAGAGLAGDADRRGGGLPPRRLHRGPRGPRARPRPRRTSSSRSRSRPCSTR